jgi:hypothetical protein
MKRILKIFGIILVVLLIGILGYTYVGYNSWSPGKVEFTIDKPSLKYFKDTYAESRLAFRENADKLKARFDSVEVFSQLVPSKIDNDLTIDFCYVPAKRDKSKLLILSSGTHGIEGFTGSAAQNMIMSELTDSLTLSSTGILFIHSLNPYGFKYLRRVTENNIDLNRNCDAHSTLFSSINKGYSDLYDLLNPAGKVKAGSLKNKFFMLVAIQKMLKASMKALRQAVLQGQYEYPEGLYFGGKGFEPQVASIAPLLVKYARDYETVLNIDLHTGYGALGVVHLFPNPVKDPVARTTMEKIFTGYKIDWGDSDDFYTINGAFSDYIGELLPGKLYMPMSFECGTLKSQTTVGSIHSIHNMILENQGFHHSFGNEVSKEKVLYNFREMYYPSSEEWRSKVMNDMRQMMKSTFTQLRNL